MNADNIFEIDSENSSFESQDILQDVSDDNITTTFATTSNNIYIVPNISNNPITLNNKKSRSQPSPVKPFFLQKTLDGKMLICSICKNQYSITTATGNLHKYLDTYHLGWDSDKQSGQQYLIFIPKITISKQILAFAQKNKFNALIAKWIVFDTLPFSVVSSKSFLTMLRYLNNSIDLPLRETMKSTIQDAFILHDIFAAFDISTKILCATTDGAHILNLIVIAGLTPIKSSIENVQNLVKAISSSSSITQDFRELGKSVSKSEAIPATQFLRPFYETTNVLFGSTYTILGFSILLVDDIINTISSYIQNSTSPEFLKAVATQMSDKLQKYMDEIYNKTAFIAAILNPCIKLELIPADINMEVNCAIFNNVFRSEYFAPILNNSLTNSETPLNLSYTEQVAYKRRINTFTDRTDEFTQYLNKAVLPMSVDSLNW
ncbi:27995_t:CDS:2 [Gigaspora margarita]|uniref:27995_t:CDS:1 n=1 Tax=Gigaspora margarita TaxID=4874 RepID=A0ABN7VID6_GIGMA|nr:27995_t:CDS:2 [Gigaspora margarita]